MFGVAWSDSSSMIMTGRRFRVASGIDSRNLVTFASLISCFLTTMRATLLVEERTPGPLSLPMSAFRLVKRRQASPERSSTMSIPRSFWSRSWVWTRRFVYMPARTMMIR
uniref:hypothetical protein n=1 Tax=Brachybacterium sp. GPGPB12 TaxID=3023517 RepID=UPI0040497361